MIYHSIYYSYTLTSWYNYYYVKRELRVSTQCFVNIIVLIFLLDKWHAFLKSGISLVLYTRKRHLGAYILQYTLQYTTI